VISKSGGNKRQATRHIWPAYTDIGDRCAQNLPGNVERTNQHVYCHVVRIILNEEFEPMILELGFTADLYPCVLPSVHALTHTFVYQTT